MRRFLVLAALTFGCSNNSLPTENNSSGATNGSTTAGTTGTTTSGTTGSTTAGTNGSTTSGTTTSGTTTSGTTTSGTTGTTTGGTTGGPGAICKTACECMPGLACYMNMCVKSPMGELYCCDDPNSCPSGSFCQSSSGQFGTCGGTMMGGCKTACDCPTGQACFNGGCVTPPTGALYCCDDGSCPSTGTNYCQSVDGSFNMCGSGGSSGSTGGTTGTPMVCDQVMCMSDADCDMIGCMRGCSMRRHVCRNF